MTFGFTKDCHGKVIFSQNTSTLSFDSVFFVVLYERITQVLRLYSYL